MIEICELCESFGTVRAVDGVDGVDLSIAAGEVVAFLGPDGAASRPPST